MAWDVHIHLAFECGDTERLEKLARSHLKQLQENVAQVPEPAIDFLEHVAAGRGVGHGRKGSLCTWGCVANHVRADMFIEALRPFWLDLWKEELDKNGELDSIMFDFNRIVVFEEEEQRKKPVAFEISFANGALVTKEFGELGFAWGQA